MSKPLLLLFALVLANGQSPVNLTGRWRSVETSQGGSGAVYQFHADGTVDFEGDQLILPPATTTWPEIKSKLTISADVLRLSAEGHGAEYHRRGNAQSLSDPLLGEWLGSREMDGRRMAEQMLFYPGGKSLLVILFTTQRGIYSTTGGRLVATFGGGAGLNGPFDISDDVLSIHRGGGRLMKLARY